jgi:hypothetical protein
MRSLSQWPPVRVERGRRSLPKFKKFQTGGVGAWPDYMTNIILGFTHYYIHTTGPGIYGTR